MKNSDNDKESFFNEKEFSDKLLEKANVIILTLDVDANIVFFNKFLEDLTGHKKEEVIGKNWLDLFIPEYIKTKIPKVFEKVLKEMPTVSSHENSILCKNGEERLISWENSVLKDSKRKIIGILSIGLDITERKKTEEKLKSLSYVVEQSTEGMAIVDLNGNIVFSNKAWCQMHGYKNPNDYLGENLTIFHNKEQIKNEVIPFNNEVKKHGTYSAEVGHITKAGKIFPTLMTTTLLKDHEGNAFAMVGIAKDITERKQAEKELQRINRSLKTISGCNQVLIHANDEKDLLNDICGIIVKVGGYRFAWVGYAEKDKKKTIRPVAQKGFEDGYLDTLNLTWADTELGRGPTGIAIRMEKPSICQNILTDPKFALWKAQAAKQGYESSVALPLISGDIKFGALNIYAVEPDTFDKEEMKLLKELADDIAYGIASLRLHIEHERAKEAILKHLNNILVLHQTSLAFSQLLKVQDIGHSIVETLEKILNWKRGSIWIINESGKELDLLAHTSMDLDQESFGEELNQVQELVKLSNDGISGWVAFHGQSVRIGNVKKDPRYIVADPQIQSELCVPMSVAGRTIGSINVESTESNAFDENDEKLLSILASQSAIAIENARLFEKVQHELTERRQTELELRQSEGRFKHLFEDLGDAVYVTVIGGARNGQILEVNPAAVKQTGYSRNELLQMNVISDLLVPDSGEISTDDWNEKLLRGETVTTSEMKRKKDGTEYWTEVIVTPIEFEGENASLSINHDITERKQAEEKLNAAYLKATESDRLKSAFLATMSHELRTPLNAIIGFSDILKSGVNTDEVEGFSTIINNSGYHLLDIVNDVFDITLLESGQSKINKEKHLLHTIINNVRDIIISEKSKLNKSIDIFFKAVDEDKDRIVFTDKAKLQQVLINVLKNALKFTHKGSIEWGYEFVIKKGKQNLLFYVKDTGIGIAPQNQSMIFDSFRQVEDANTREFEGTGIGLSISRKIVELLGGKIWLESELGIGSTFYFNIPCLVPQEVISETKEIISPPQMAPYANKIILIVEDDESNFVLLKTYLKPSKVKILWAKNGKEAVEYCNTTEDIDLVLMDLKMPVMNGFIATAKIKEKFPDLAVIAQTAYAISGDKEKALEAGCDAYIAKPIKKNELYNLIEKYLKE